MDCVFCSILNGGMPASTIRDTEMSVAMLDAFPLAKGHVLVVPKSHRERIQDMTPAENADLFGLVQRMVPAVDSVSGATLVAVHNGKGAGQEVPHVHVHLVPRKMGDSAGPIHSMFGSSPGMSAQEAQSMCAKLKSASRR